MADHIEKYITAMIGGFPTVLAVHAGFTSAQRSLDADVVARAEEIDLAEQIKDLLNAAL